LRSIVKTPDSLVQDGRVVEFGVFSEPFRKLNLEKADIFAKGDKIPEGLVRFRLKEWQHFGIVHPEHYIGLVIFNAKFLGISFVYHYDRATKVRVEHSRQGPGSRAVVAETTWNGECSFAGKGYRIEMHNRLEDGYHEVAVEVAARKELPGISGQFRMLENINNYDPLVIVSPFAANRPLYTHKAACPVEGRLVVGEEVIDFDPERDVCLLDEQKAFYPYRSFWKWMTFAGHDKKGRLIAANLCQNNIGNDEEYSENCYWLNGKIHLTGAARFGFSEADILGPWFINTTDRLADLEFRPEGERAERIKVGPIMSDFHQPFGLFNGRLGKGGRVAVEDLFGLCEQHVTRY
jgi:Domain of unknown function (DUF2804), C-terminal/Domain of unknown function (DUF2804), N-terminal